MSLSELDSVVLDLNQVSVSEDEFRLDMFGDLQKFRCPSLA
jgi:hypothetical protein